MIQIFTNESRKRQRDRDGTSEDEYLHELSLKDTDFSNLCIDLTEFDIVKEEKIKQIRGNWQLVPKRLISMKSDMLNQNHQPDWILIPNLHAKHFLRIEKG